ncbi:PAS domain-containing sensor histidine kinase [Chitinophaga silvisoli]|uniref:histidine kinase n=1 Tax=Chitinophaga silvisoli TaxID=2291814 RepID=A0A3E1P0L6_9BACT|nr:ATP-binding protein [Chitinophaga silvisoli]RFM33712.1 PAS domain-containing protein [Chitinophaga silvisoli]
MEKQTETGTFREENNEEWMHFALLSAGLGTWNMDPLNKEVKWDDRCRELYGFPEGQVIEYQDILRYIHPDDKARVDQAVTNALKSESGGNYSVRFRTIGAKDKKIRWLDCKGKAYFHPDGTAYRFAGTAQDITREIEDRDREELMIALVENSPDYMAAADNQGRFFYMNTAGKRLLGISDSFDITSLVNKDLFLPDDFTFMEEEVYPHLLVGRKWSGNIHIQHARTKERIPCYADFIVIREPGSDKIIGRGATLRDLRPALQAKQEQQKLLALLENSRDFVSLSDNNGIVSYVNPAGLQLVGLDTVEEAKRPNTEFLFPEAVDSIMKEIDSAIAEKGQWTGEVNYRNFKTGEAIPVFTTTMRVIDTASGASQGKATISRDLRQEKAIRQQQTENRAELERMVEMRTSELKKANIDLNIVNQNLEQFAYVASHDLQEPLRKINMFSALLQDKYQDQLNETGMRNLGIIRNAATRMTTLIQDLLAFSRVSRQDHLFEAVDLQKIIQQVLTDLDMLIQQKDAVIEMDALCSVYGIPLHMTQLFHNLLSNALKFTQPDKQVVVKIDSRILSNSEVAAHPQLQNGMPYCEIRVTDNGIGFAPTYAKKIFVIFQRLHGRGEYEGSGIGLALCQKIVTAHHGVIYAESEEGKGATFIVILPVFTS